MNCPRCHKETYVDGENAPEDIVTIERPKFQKPLVFVKVGVFACPYCGLPRSVTEWGRFHWKNTTEC